MKKAISFICIFALLVSLSCVLASAVPTPSYLGDANLDGKTTIQDATAVQKYVAKMIDFTLLQKTTADADKDGSITVRDATAIQKDIAGIEPIFDVIFTHVSCRGFYASFDSGKAMTGTEVEFTAFADTVMENARPLVYELYINEELIEQSENPTFAYTFEKSGVYDIKINCTNAFGYSDYCGFNAYEVVEPYESETPVIKAFNSNYSRFGDNEINKNEVAVTFTAEAIFGKGDYKYAFLLDGKLIQDYSEDNSYTFEDMPEHRDENYVITVRVKDSSTADGFVSEDYRFKVVY